MKMKKDKVLLSVENINDIEEYKKLGITNFLFPLKGYSIGYPSFTFDEIKDQQVDAYILANRLLEDEDIDEFLKLKIPKNVKGFIIEDIGLLEVLKNAGYHLIVWQNHLNNNYKTVNHWLNHFDSLVISTDIREVEIENIVKKAIKPLVLNTFGYPMIMYSRRTLISNYERYKGLDITNNLVIQEEKLGKNFMLRESPYGTVVFDSLPIDYRSIIENIDYNIEYYLINTQYLDKSVIIKVLNDEPVASTRGFLDKATIYRIGDIK